MVRRVAIVVPSYNEAVRLPADRFREFLRDTHEVGFVLVNDGSTDDTLRVLETIRDGFEAEVDVLDLARNLGKAEAVRRGVLHALPAAPEFVGFWDADLATPLQMIPAFCRLLASRPDLEMVFGARVKLLGRRIHRRPARHYVGRVFATLVSRMLGLAIYDTQCGAKLFRVTPDLRQLFAEPFATRWLFDVEILARLLRLRRGTDRPQPEDVIYEYPLEQWVDVAGSKVRPLHFFAAVAGLVRIRRRYFRATAR